MEEIREHMDQTVQQLNLIDDFVALSLKRNKIVPQVIQCLALVQDAKELMEKVNIVIEHKLNKINEQYEENMARMQKQQATVLERILELRRSKHAEAEREEQMAISGTSNSAGNILLNPHFNLLPCKRELHTPLALMKIADYRGSPLVKCSTTKLKAIAISFEDFDYTISQQAFDTIPKYMRGRESLDELNQFLEHTVISCFNEKYKLMHRQREMVRQPAEKDRWLMYNQQASYIPGHNFITLGDMSRQLGRTIDKKTQNRITMLRHIGVLQERRVSQTVCYIWNV